MANVMSTEKRNTILRLMVEGNSVRSITRLVGTNIPTVLRQLHWAGYHCGCLLADRLQGLRLRHVECDEIWTFCRKKQAHLTTEEAKWRWDMGDMYLWTAQDQDTRLIAAHLVGKRSADNARRIMVQLRNRLDRLGVAEYPTIQVSTDGYTGYPEAVDLAFGTAAKYGQIIKRFRNARMQYDPSQMIGTIRRSIRAMRYHERDICTSHCERNNLTIRTFMRRFTRLALGFSRKIENLEAAVNLHVAYYNFCWQPGELGTTPAVAAGIAANTWKFDELLAA